MTWSVLWTVVVDGVDMTDAFRPVLIDITVTDKDGTASDTCAMKLDDSDGRIALPREGARVEVRLEGVPVFAGTVDSVRFELSRGGARVLDVGAKGFDAKGKVKSGQRWHLDDATLGDALRRAGAAAGLAQVDIDPAFADIRRDYWSPDGETFLGWGSRLARELGATFKIRDGRAVFARRGEGRTPSGASLPTVTATVGLNVVSCSIAPVANRQRFGRARVRFFDRETAAFRERSVEIEEGVDAADEVQTASADEAQAGEVAAGRRASAERDGGSGRIEMLLTPQAQAEGALILRGARPGIDGTYRITGVTHKADRSGGASTSLDLAQPQGEARKDARKPNGQVASRIPAEEVAGSTGTTALLETSVHPSGGGFAGSPEFSGRLRL